MLSALTRAFRTPDLRAKLLLTLSIMTLFQLGSILPAPDVNLTNAKYCIGEAGKDQNLLSLVNVFSGGTLLQLSVFALSIMPYIVASITIQLLRVVIPRSEELHKEGQASAAKLTKYTRYLTIGLGLLQSSTIMTTAKSGQLFREYVRTQHIIAGDSIVTPLLIIITMTAGTGLVMWLGELITERGIDNGMSLLIFTSIVAQFPSDMFSIAGGNSGAVSFTIIVAVVLLATLAVVYIEQTQRRIPVQYAKRIIGRRQYGGSTTHIPVKINTAGVIPVIFASSILAMPQLVAGFSSQASEWVQWITTNLQQTHPIYLIAYSILILPFAFFYTTITFGAKEIADNMRCYGGFISDIRAGEPTVRYLSYVINRITTAGSIHLVVLALIPTLAVIWLDLAQHLPFGRTTILIMADVGPRTVKGVSSRLQQRHYEGFLS